MHRRFPKTFTPALISNLSIAISAPPKATLATLTPEQREKDDSTRVTRQRPIVRVSSELALVGIIKDAPDRSGGEWIMKAMKELVSWSEILIPRRLSLLSYRMTPAYLLCRFWQRSWNLIPGPFWGYLLLQFQNRFPSVQNQGAFRIAKSKRLAKMSMIHRHYQKTKN